MADNTVTLVGNVTRDPELRYTTRRARRGQLRPRRQPPVPGQRRVAGADVVLQRRRLGHARRERRRVHQQGHPPRRVRSPRAALVGDAGRREAHRRRGHRRRARTQPALGPGPGRARPPAPGPTAPVVEAAVAARPPVAAEAAHRTPSTATKSRSENPCSSNDEGELMASKKNRARASKDTAPRKYKKKTSALVTEKVEYVDYKDVDLLSPVHERPRQDPQPSRQRQRRPAAARGRRTRSRSPARWRSCRTPSACRRSAPVRRGDGPSPAVTASRRDRGPHRGRSRRPTRPEVDDADEPRRRTELMKVILRSDVNGTRQARRHRRGRRRLRPQLPAAQGPGLLATAGAVDQAAKMRRSRDMRDASDREAAQTIATRLVPKIITIPAKPATRASCSARSPSPTSSTRCASRPASTSSVASCDSDPIKTLGSTRARPSCTPTCRSRSPSRSSPSDRADLIEDGAVAMSTAPSTRLRRLAHRSNRVVHWRPT